MGEPKYRHVIGIHTFSQFRAVQAETIKQKELCVPSEKGIIK